MKHKDNFILTFYKRFPKPTCIPRILGNRRKLRLGWAVYKFVTFVTVLSTVCVIKCFQMFAEQFHRSVNILTESSCI
jgi:hypothetical protein